MFIAYCAGTLAIDLLNLKKAVMDAFDTSLDQLTKGAQVHTVKLAFEQELDQRTETVLVLHTAGA